MFKSAETLRLAAEMRALQKVASPWREARTTWFDGTPESIEARIAATERVLTFARAGMTDAHLGLEREAAHACAELKEARHRLMVDFLDDSARAFKGSKRVAGKHDADPDEPWKNRATGEDTTTEHWEKNLPPWDEDYEGKHREARAPEENENWEEGASYAEYKGGKCTRCKSNNIDASGGHGTGEYDCYDCGATFHPKVRKLKSHRVAGGIANNDISFTNTMGWPSDKDDNRFTLQRFRDVGPDETIEDRRKNPSVGIFNHDSSEMMTNDGAHHWAGRRVAAPAASVGEGGASLPGMGPAMMGGDQGAVVSTSIPGAIGKAMWNGSTTTGQEPTPAFNPGPKAASLRLAAAAFIDAQNTRDRDELALRAARHVAGMTGQLPGPVAEAAGQVFVAAVLAGCDDRTKKGHRTAAVLTDFADELMF
jgi:hypothetical protein